MKVLGLVRSPAWRTEAVFVRHTSYSTESAFKANKAEAPSTAWTDATNTQSQRLWLLLREIVMRVLS